MIAEAEKAAKALEIAATKSPIAQASLLETRKLIAEAVRSLESIEAEPNSWQEKGEEPSVVPDELGSQIEKEGEVLIKADRIKVNGTRTLASSKKEEFNFGKLNLQDILNGEEGVVPISSSDYGLSLFSYETLIKQSDSRNENGQLEKNRDNGQQEKPLLNGATKVESPKEESPAVETGNEQTPANSVTVTKKWIRGRLVEVAEGAA